MLFNRPDNLQNCPFPLGDLDTHLTRGSLGPPKSDPKTASRSVQPFSISSAIFAGLINVTNRQRYRLTHWLTDHATLSAATGCYRTAMRPNNGHRFIKARYPTNGINALMVGWEINVPFQHKNSLYRGQGLWWRFSFIKLRTANDTVTSQYCSFLFSDDPKWKRIGEAHKSYHASAYNRVETNQRPQNLFIS